MQCKNVAVYLTKQPSLQKEMVGDTLKKNPSKLEKAECSSNAKKERKREKKHVLHFFLFFLLCWCEATTDRIT